MAYIKVINNTKTFPSGDETTGALDFETGRAVMQILQDMSRKQGSTVSSPTTPPWPRSPTRSSTSTTAG